MKSKYATPPSKKSKQGNSIHQDGTKGKKITVSEELAYKGQCRRACETLDMARCLGEELLEVWE